MDGTAKEVLKTIPRFLDDIFKSSIKSLSPGIELTYTGFRYMSPKEEFTRMLAGESNKTIYDLAVSDLYMVEYIFDYEGTPIKRQLYLPFAGDGNLIRISNTSYVVVPVLSDTVISPSYKEVFVRLLKDKLIFRGTAIVIVVNEEKIAGQVIHSNIIKTSALNNKDNIGKPLTAMTLYLLCEYGLKESVRKYLKTDKYFVTDRELTLEERDMYNVYESSKQKPRKLITTAAYSGHDVKFCIHKSVERTAFMDNFVFGFIYLLDIFPLKAEDCLGVLNGRYINDLHVPTTVYKEKLFWRMMLGRITFKGNYSIERIVMDVNEHFDTLQGYVDNLVKTKLAENDIAVDNFFDLIVVIMENFNIWLLNNKEYNSDIANRYIDILYYMLYEIIVGFNRIILNANKRATKKRLSSREINKIFSNELSPRKIFSLVKSSAMNLCISPADYTSDIKYPKNTSPLEDQLVFCNRNVA